MTDQPSSPPQSEELTRLRLYIAELQRQLAASGQASSDLETAFAGEGEPGAGRPDHPADQPYGDLTELNTDRTIMDLTGKEVLRQIAEGCLTLLKTSSAVYEANGDYAMGLLTSGWCRLLDNASRQMCGTDDNREALKSGKWLCHESCWREGARRSIETGEPTDVECAGGIRLYSVPIVAGNETVGSMNFGYGAPPRDPERLREIANKYDVPLDELKAQAEAYVPRPPVLIEIAKRHLDVSANLIGEIVRSRKAEEALLRSNARLKLLSSTASRLLSDYHPQEFVRTLYRRLSAELGLEVYFNYLTTAGGERLHLDSYSGISEEAAAGIELLEYGQAVCGTVALRHARMVVEDVQKSADDLTELIRSIGIQAYACYPLVARGRLIGTLSFGTRGRTRFDAEELELMQAVADQVAMALERSRLLGEMETNNRDLENANTALARSNADLQQFASVASHDLQEPLRMIGGYAQLLSRRYREALGSEGEEFLGFIRDGVSRMDMLIRDLLAYARTGEAAAPLEPVDLNSVVGSVRQNLHAAIVESGAEITYTPLPTLMADGTQIIQLFQNLLANAIKYRGERSPHIRITAERRGGHWLFRVEDNGVGFRPEHAELAFQPFRRLKNTAKSGTGIGLAICRRIVERHGGRIWAESTPGEGSVFFFTLATRSRG